MISALPLTLLTLVSAVSYVRVFDEPSSVVPALLVGFFAHAALRVGALARAQAVVLGTVVLGGAGLIVTWTIAPHTTAYGVPTGETLQVLGERLGDGFGALRTANVPIGPHDGIVLVVAVGVFMAAVAADWVAFQARAVLSACIPAATLFTLTATLGEDRHEALLMAGMVAAALSFILAHAPAQAGDAHSWFASGTRTLGPGAVLRAGLPLVVLAAAAAPFVGPRLPEARSAGLVDLSPGPSSPRTRVTVSPLVDIRDRLTRNPPVDVFTVRASQPAYWRMAALETFDGEIWSSLADYRRADDELPTDSTAAPTVPLVQDYQISNLAQFWLPAAYRPVSIDLPGTRVNVDSLTLLTERETADGVAYRVESAVPVYGPADLAGETGRIPDEVLPFIEVPEGLSTVVGQLAREVTAGDDTTYERALALQAFFRENFTYSEEVPAGHSGNRLVDFLTTARAGFCEQFS
ncbi:MAG TPA: DUF3488 and transglutaminase-like domain-containing protein, partial [Acidimicrobiia bacterium]|nr:DUF3488 and transglutaminase-like domain-containing protein [Acidimicrobiia bacterium]